MKISVIGSINRDQNIYIEKIPRRGETVVGKSVAYFPGGKGANQAAGMAKLGADVRMFGAVGRDAAGEEMLKSMREDGLNTEYIRIVDDVPTGQAIITVDASDNSIIIISGANEKVDLVYVKSVEENIMEADLIVLQNEIPIPTIHYLIRAAYARGKKILLNPAPALTLSEDLLNMLTYVTPNEHEVNCLLENFHGKPQDLLKKYKGKLIVTQGKIGCSVCIDGKRPEIIPGIRANVVDTSGAGDSFNAAFCVAVLKGMPLKDALRFGNTAAGLSTEKKGARGGMPSMEDICARDSHFRKYLQ